MASKVYVANFGEANWAWPECKRRSSIVIMDDDDLHPFWERGDRDGYIKYATSRIKTRAGTPVPAMTASRWYAINDIIHETEDDLWIHVAPDEDRIWWTYSRKGNVERRLETNPNARPGHSTQQWMFLRPADAWRSTTLKGASLSYKAQHPKVGTFLFTVATLVQLSPRFAAYARALIAGDDLSSWHNAPDFQAKLASSKAGTSTTLNSWQRTWWQIADMVQSTIAASGSQVTTLRKDKAGLDKEQLIRLLPDIYERQEGMCSLTGLQMVPWDDPDVDMRASLDRIDSAGHYLPENLQLVCRFANFWKRDRTNDDMLRLIALVRSVSGAT